MNVKKVSKNNKLKDKDLLLTKSSGSKDHIGKCSYITSENGEGYREWYLEGERHREDGPAVEYPDGRKYWYLNDKLHREDGPALEWSDGTKSWYLNGNAHREDGPAVTSTFSDYCEWHVHDVEMTEEEFNIWVSKNKLHQKLLTKLEAKDDDKKTKI